MTDIIEITQAVLDTAAEFNEDLETNIDIERGGDAELFGVHGVLDSMNLVAFIVAVEQEIAMRFNVEVTLADEKAMSQNQSPFRTVGSLVNHISNIISGLQS